MEEGKGEQAEQVVNQAAQDAWNSVSSQVEKIWWEIFQTADKILKVHIRFGFEKFAEKIDPSIEEILFGMKVVESLFDRVEQSLDYTEQRMLMNARQQILWVEDLAVALKNNDEPRYKSAIEKMHKQAVV